MEDGEPRRGVAGPGDVQAGRTSGGGVDVGAEESPRERAGTGRVESARLPVAIGQPGEIAINLRPAVVALERPPERVPGRLVSGLRVRFREREQSAFAGSDAAGPDGGDEARARPGRHFVDPGRGEDLPFTALEAADRRRSRLADLLQVRIEELSGNRQGARGREHERVVRAGSQPPKHEERDVADRLGADLGVGLSRDVQRDHGIPVGAAFPGEAEHLREGGFGGGDDQQPDRFGRRERNVPRIERAAQARLDCRRDRRERLRADAGSAESELAFPEREVARLRGVEKSQIRMVEIDREGRSEELASLPGRSLERGRRGRRRHQHHRRGRQMSEITDHAQR